MSARPTRSVDAVVFDMDGTLFDSSTVVPDAYIETIVGLGGPSYTREQVIDTYGLGPSGPMIEYLLGRSPTEPDIAAYHSALARTASRVSVYPGVPEALAALAARVPLAVFTGADVRACAMLMERRRSRPRTGSTWPAGGWAWTPPAPRTLGTRTSTSRRRDDPARWPPRPRGATSSGQA